MNSKLVCQHTTQRQMNFRFVNAVITVVAFSLLNLRNVPAVLTFKSVNKLGRCSVKIQIKPLWTAVLLLVLFFFFNTLQNTSSSYFYYGHIDVT